MNRSDTTTRRTAFAIVVAVGVFAGGDSYAHLYHLARVHGQDVISAALLPLAGDGLVFAASSAIMAAARNGKAVPVKARVLLYGGTAASAVPGSMITSCWSVPRRRSPVPCGLAARSPPTAPSGTP